MCVYCMQLCCMMSVNCVFSERIRRGGGVVERRLLGVAFDDGAGSGVSGEVEWLVPANHAATE